MKYIKLTPPFYFALLKRNITNQFQRQKVKKHNKIYTDGNPCLKNSDK